MSTSEWIEVAKDLNAGTIAGIAGIVAGQPFDTIKVRLQTQAEALRMYMRSGHTADIYRGSIHCFKQILQSEGVRGLYKGMFSPIISNAPINAVVFAVYGQAIRVVNTRGDAPRPIDHCTAGMAAGFIQTAFSSPAELIKITMQVDRSTVKQSAIGRARELVHRHGVRKGLYHGWAWTAARDTPAFGIYFYSYDYGKKLLFSSRGKQDDFNAFLAGGVAGTLSWAILHPIDVVKSLYQMQSVSEGVKGKDIILRNLKKDGPGFLMNGFGATCLRAFPVSAVTFVVYEKIIQFIQ